MKASKREAFRTKVTSTVWAAEEKNEIPIGIESVDDIIANLRQALDKISEIWAL